MSCSLRVDVGRPLVEAEGRELEIRLSRRLGLVMCVRHSSAIDDVTVDRTENATAVVVSACCEFSERRAKAIVNEAIANLPDDFRPDPELTSSYDEPE
jgi:hypothetical protein